MKRREFISKTALFSLLLAGLNPLNVFGSGFNAADGSLPAITGLGAPLALKFKELLKWLEDNGWIAYLNKTLSLNIDAADTDINHYLQKQGFAKVHGFDDFAGHRLIEPGYPAGSLLYHALASPRVKPPGFGPLQYPGIAQLDVLENIIYGLKAMDGEDWNNMVLAVFAYEYRPAYKTPHHKYADMVFSRTGIARIGEYDMNYDAVSRCFVNKPAVAGKTKNIAVAPARYGLFLAKKVTGETGITLMGKATDGNDPSRAFLQPVRKIFSDDTLINVNNIAFKEYHITEKLYSLVKKSANDFDNPVDKSGKPKFDIEKPPFKVESNHSANLVKSMAVGSSVLITSVPAPLVRLAVQNNQRIFLKVTKDDQAYFSALNTAHVGDEEVLDIHNPPDDIAREVNDYAVPRNVPMFVNIKYMQDKKDPSKLIRLDTTEYQGHVFDNYKAGLFEDSICDGCVTVDTSLWTSSTVPPAVLKNCLPAFSIITAPDFFPFVDPFDLLEFDLAANPKETNFFEGGLYSLCSERTAPNQRLVNPATGKAAFDVNAPNRADTFTAVLCEDMSEKTNSGDFSQPADRDYQATSFLPDVCSGIFAPGWDITYANDTPQRDMYGQDEYQKKDSYLSTRGLGSPFAEDMKLCAAMDGMWPAASPDAARTYQGSLDVDYRNPASIPLLDTEIGLHKDSPACRALKIPESLGWDGEQGPFLERKDGRILVNFTDLASADYIENAMQGKLNMSLLRDLTSAELRARMACLKLCVKKLPQFDFDQHKVEPENGKKIVGFTGLWLVSAEKVADWGQGAKGIGIPPDLAGSSAKWATGGRVSGPGYLYVFAVITKPKDYWPDKPSRKRKLQTCSKIFVCQVAGQQIAWTELPAIGPVQPENLDWHS
jgi:hypothetical protein